MSDALSLKPEAYLVKPDTLTDRPAMRVSPLPQTPRPHAEISVDRLDEIEELKQRIAELEAENAEQAMRLRTKRTKLLEFEAMVETAPVGILIADASGRITYGNHLVEEMLRHPIHFSENVDDYHEWTAFHGDGSKVDVQEYPLARVLAGETYSELDVQYLRGDDTQFWMRIIGRPVFDANDNRIGAAVALIDIDRERKLQDTQQILIRELNHRVKNAFSVVKSIVNQSLRYSSVEQHVRRTLDHRLDAYAAAHGRLMDTKWQSGDFKQVVTDIVDHVAPGRVSYSGPPHEINSGEALAFSMAFYELATNAIKYGALSVPEGRVTLTWDLQDIDEVPSLIVNWTELNGPAVVRSERKGFGSFITNRAIALETGGTVEMDFKEAGVSWTCIVPIEEE